MPDRREPEQSDDSNRALAWTAILRYLGRLGARRQIRHRLRSDTGRKRLEGLCGENLPAVPHGDAVEDYLVPVDPAAVRAIPQAMVRALLESRRLEDFRLLGRYYLVTCDRSGHLYLGDRPSEFTAGCLTVTTGDGRTLYDRPACESKLVTRSGLALCLGTEFVENKPGLDPVNETQGSELPAAERLFPRVKAAFPGFAFCALLDARSCNQTGFALCEKNDGRFIITLQEGSLASVWQEFQTLRCLPPGNRLTVWCDEVRHEYAWVNDIAYGTRKLNVLECCWTDEKGDPRFVWVTDIRIDADNGHLMAQEGGPRRWKTEKEGFRAQKHGGFEMEHAYAKRPNCAKNFYLLLQVAHILSQMLECYCKGKKAVQRTYGSLRNLGRAFLESFRRDPAPDPDTLRQFLDEPIQIRLNSSRPTASPRTESPFRAPPSPDDAAPRVTRRSGRLTPLRRPLRPPQPRPPSKAADSSRLPGRDRVSGRAVVVINYRVVLWIGKRHVSPGGEAVAPPLPGAHPARPSSDERIRPARAAHSGREADDAPVVQLERRPAHVL